MKLRLFAAVSAAALLTAFTGFVTPAAPVSAAGIVMQYADAEERVLSGAVYTIRVRLSGKMLTASEGNVQQWEDRADASQRWKIVRAADGTCALFSAESPALAMTVDGADGTNGSNISLQPYTGSDAQQFYLTKIDDAFTIRAKCSETAVLDVYDISYENGANIDQWDYWGGEGQKFYIRPADDVYTLLRGDLDMNGRLNACDLSLLKRGLMTGFDAVSAQIADCSGDGTVDLRDARLLMDGLLGDFAFADPYCEIPYSEPAYAYLFAYFLGNAPEQERLSYAVSLDGLNFHALNRGAAVWQSSVGTGCIRDPYIFKGEDGFYYMLATDMKSSLGWSSNRNLISAKSTDLIHWFDESLIEIANKYPNMMNCDRAWAPQAIYDPEKQSYMIYFAARVPGTDDRTVMYYAYSRDMKTLDTAPALLFAPANGNDAIDSDIIFKDGTYYMYYKNETNKRIYLATASHAAGPYAEGPQISEGSLGVEGPNIYPVIGKDEWLLMSDAYGDGYYVMQRTGDLTHFTGIDRAQYSFDFTPRHGYVIQITKDQYLALTNAFPSARQKPVQTVVRQTAVYASVGGQLTMPETVTACYSDGGTAELPVTWDLSSVNMQKAGTYTAAGQVQTADYANPFIAERADPYVVQGDGCYYFTASFPAYGSADKGYDRIILRKSNTVAGLASAEEKTIWNAHPSGILAKHIWAPELHQIGGVWYIFFAAGSSDNVWAIRPYVLKCSGEPFTGTWTECGQMKAAAGDDSSFQNFSLDMTYFSCGGKHYVIWAEIKGDSSLFMAQIDPSAPWQLTSAPILLTKPEYDWELVNNRVNEGAAVLQMNGKVYVFFSASGTGSEYCVGLLEADASADLMNTRSWKKYSEPRLSSRDLYGESGPGHNSFVTDENGNLLIVYHARPSAHDTGRCGTYSKDPLYDPCRHTRIRQVYVDADGVPDIALTAQEFLSDRTVTATVTVG